MKKQNKSVKYLTSVFNIPDIEQDIDYKKLYEKQKKLREFYQKKYNECEKQLRKYFKENKIRLSKNKKLQLCNVLEEIKSFKNMLPNSIKQIQFQQDGYSFQNRNKSFFIKQFAIYGVTEHEISKAVGTQKFQGSIVHSNQIYSQILQHTSKLVYPSGIYMDYYFGQSANQKCLDIMNLSHQKLKSFVLSFEPVYQKPKNQASQRDCITQSQRILNIVNPERRIYAICTIVQDFTIINKQKSASFKTVQSLKSNKRQTQKSVDFKQIDIKVNNLNIIVTKRAICLFSYFPFFSFFDQMLRNLLYSTKIQRYIRYKQNGQSIQKVDSRLHGELIKNKLESIQEMCNEKQIGFNRLIDFSIGSNKIYLQLTQQSCGNYLSSQWAYTIFSLFTLDNFLDVFTLLLMEQKMIFVCQDKSILTYAIFLFTKVLVRPFSYPFPVVNLIPDQEQYFNAPFPIVYGYNKSKKQVIDSKICKKYKNTYVFFQPNGIQIISHDQNALINKSPKLRDMLMPCFKKMRLIYPNSNISFFDFLFKNEKQDFNYVNNKQLSLEIINEVHTYMLKFILKLLPTRLQIQEITKKIRENKDVDEDEINILVFNTIRDKYGMKSKDPFYNAFLKTQLLNVYIFNY